ncbi:hypothetical protein LR48_Vigan10g104900 [Vigna angularis]|uniref:Uncharacterized protein n=1 Tax=Phaseolus angularis TaxID=3914 RepID=A0A0L9VJR5_PHAAN|nr:hypothetical protein LR48_Vigan10g104900 [Vigna angularis]
MLINLQTCNLLIDRPNSGIKAWFVLVIGSDEYNNPYTESLPGKGYPGKRVLLRYDGWKGLLVVVVGWQCFRWRGSVPMWKGLTLEGEIVGNPSVSSNPTLDRNEKVEQYIKVKDPLTHCLKVLGKEWC